MAYKTFTAGTLATASDVNTYLMKQSVMVFADATARNAALTAPTEGMVTYQEAANHLTVYTGTEWVPFDVAGWNTYTPTFTNVTVGNGTLVARYIQLGKAVHLHVRLTLGTTSAVSGTPIISLPVATASGRLHTGTGNATNGTTNFLVETRYGSTTTTQAYVFNAANTFLERTNINGVSPFTWASTHILDFNLTYEAA